MVVRLARHPRRHVPPPAISTPAATHQHPSSPDTPAAGLANAAGEAVTGARLPFPPPPPTCRATAGNTVAGGETPGPLPAQLARRRACQRRRRSSNRWNPPFPAPPPTRRAAAGNIDAGGDTPAPLPARLPFTPPSPQHTEPPPAIPTPAATRHFPCPPHTCAAGRANAGGGAIT